MMKIVLLVAVVIAAATACTQLDQAKHSIAAESSAEGAQALDGSGNPLPKK